MKRKRGSAKRKPPKKPQVAVANTEPANSAFLNSEDYSDRNRNEVFDSRMEAETEHGGTNMRCHPTGLQEAGSLGETNAGNLIHNSNLLKSVANFADKLSRAVGSSSVELTNNALRLQGDNMQERGPKLPHLDSQYNEQELNAALSVIKKIMKMDAAKAFNLPVDPIALEIPDYFDVIDTPMDFGTIHDNLVLGRKYRNSQDVYKDVQLIWDNCSKYNKKGDYILELMKRVKINFIKHWNTAGLCRQGQEVDNETNLHCATECFTRQNKGGNMFPSVSMISNSIHQEQPDFGGFCQLPQQNSPCFSHRQSQHLLSQCQFEWKSMEFQSLQPHCTGHFATAESTMGHNLHTHMSRGGPSGGKHYSQQQDDIWPQQELSHQFSPSCGPQCHPKERTHKNQSTSSHLHPSTIPVGTNTQSAGHFHGVSSSSMCKNCDHTCALLPMSCNANNHKHCQMCSCHIQEHQSSLRCSDQYQPHQKSCQHHSNSRKILSTEHVGDSAKGVNPNMHTPVESTVRLTKGRLGYHSAPANECSSHQQQCQIGPSRVQPSSMIHSNSHWPQEKSCQCQFNVGLPEPHLPQHRPNVGGAEHSRMPPPVESTVRHATCQPADSGTPVTVDSSDQEECQMGQPYQSPSLDQPYQSSSLDQPYLPRENVPQPSMDKSYQTRENTPLCQPNPSMPEPSMPQDGASTRNADSTVLEKKTRVRGPTRCLKWLGEGKRISITTDELGQPVGLEAHKFISFLGTLARNGHMAPLTFVNWRAMPEENKENMWQEVQTRFEIDQNSKAWVIKSLGTKWKNWKSNLKTAHYITHTTDEDRLADRDERVLPEQWAFLVSHWSSEKAEKRSATNKANRAKQKFGHITGTKSFARIREELRVTRPDGKAPSRAELFILTRTRKDGKPVDEASSAVITQLRESANQQNGGTSKNSTAVDDVFSQLVGRDTRGRVRCYELDPSPSELGGAKPTKAEAVKMAAEANSEVRQMKEQLVSMEQTCAEMARQMATMMSMMSTMQKSSRDDNVPNVVQNCSGTSQGAPKQQTTALRRSSRRGNV